MNGRYWDKAWSRLFSTSGHSFSKRIRNVMYFSMTDKTQGYAIINNISQFGKISERFNMVWMKVTPSFIPTVLACIFISFKNRFSPSLIFSIVSRHFNFRGNTSFPIWIIRTIKRTIAVCAFSLTRTICQINK